MNDMFTSLLVIIITVVFVIGLFLFLNFRKKKENELLIQFADAKDWTLQFVRERLVYGYRITGLTDGVSWEFESLATSQDAPAAPGSSATKRRICWHCGDIGLSTGAAAIGPKMPGNDTSIDLGGFQGLLMQQAMRVIFGENADLMNGIHPVHTGSAEFQRHYMAWAQREEDIGRLLRGVAEEELLTFQGNKRLLLKLTRTGLDISVPQGEKLSLPEVERLINLGSKITRFWES